MDTHQERQEQVELGAAEPTVFTNARLVLADRVVDGSITVENGIITEIAHTPVSASGTIDCGGDLLMPGLVELHTDALEKHMQPRPGAHWPAMAAVFAHDSQLAATGITTVLDAIALGAVMASSTRVERLTESIDSLCKARDNNLLRADHLLHLRCELTYEDLPTLLDALIDHPMARLVSLMDHTPGQRQFTDEKHYRIYYQGKYSMNDAEMDSFIDARRKDQVIYGDKHRRYVLEQCWARGISLASHDDTTVDHVEEAREAGVSIAEFPTTIEAARTAHRHGIKVMMGGPNIVRGQSHSGNISARELAVADLLDIISSDYVPGSLLHAPFLLAELIDGIDLPAAIRTVTKNPSESVGLDDRGEITPGRRADLIRVHPSPHHPIVRGVWRQGLRVA